VKYSVLNPGTVLNGLFVVEEEGEVFSRELTLCQDFGGRS
jgi:alpha-galactosidase